jgi:AraC family transcriptional regulator
MIAQAFPDLAWLKQQISQRFANRRGPGNLALDSEGFPSVIINAKTSQTYRDDVTGPISLFLNLQGESRCKVDGRTVVIKDDAFFISNRFQPYSLEIETNQPIETFNIHIGEYFSEDVLRGLMRSSDTLLNEGQQAKVPTIAFFNRLHKRDDAFNLIVHSLQSTRTATGFNKLLFEEKMAELLVYLLAEHRHVLDTVQKMPAAKPSTRIELYKRLGFALDYIHTNYLSPIQLEELAAVSHLSKFHFLRLFKSVCKASPYQYILQLKLDEAKRLLLKTPLPISNIADVLGFENSSSFSRLFHQRTGVYPSTLRA